MLSEETKTHVHVLDMSKYLGPNKAELIKTLCYHGRTMIMMYQVTHEVKYLQRAQLDLYQARSIKECGFVRPLGCYLAA